MAPLPFATYPGGKNGDGVYQTIINHIPKHWTFVSLFLGGGYIFAKKTPAYKSFLNDKSVAVFEAWAEHPSTGLNALDPAQLFHMDWREFMEKKITHDSYFNKSGTFIFIDPPYPQAVRSSGRKIYDCEMMSEEAHKELLAYFMDPKMKAHWMICSYPNSLYEKMLQGSYTHTYTGRSRNGHKEEKIWMNYDISTLTLHDYRYLGANYKERDRIKQKRKRWVKGLENMEAREREAILSDIKTTFL